MLVPLSLLKEFLDIDLDIQSISDILTLAGLEVDKVEDVPFTFQGVIVAKVEKADQHPNADRLKVATVFDGKERFQVVCGAPNCREGLITAFAKVGAELTDEKGKKWKIKQGKLRDVESNGMLCASSELGLGEDSDGIMELDEMAPIGMPLNELLGDTIFEITLTPNLGHCSSVLGVARELAAHLNLQVRMPNFTLEEASENIADGMSVHIGDGVDRYACRIIKDIKVGPSPNWLKTRLENAGVRSINNIVDVTNYVMIKLGQPMHAFDLEKIGKQIKAAFCTKPTKIETLDGEVREVPAGSLMIADENGPLAIAGVMGGASSEVSDATTSIMLESANFDSSMVRKASKALSLRSESSARFERMIDHEMVPFALNYAASLIEALAGGKVLSGMIDENAKPTKDRTLKLRLHRVNALLGTELSLNEVEDFLSKLEMRTLSDGDGVVNVTIPSYRNDVTSEIDLVEEVARVYGYNNIPRCPLNYTPSKLPHDPIVLLEENLRERLISEGLQEFVTCDLISPELAELTLEENLGEQALVHVLHPSSVDQSVLRTSLLPGLLQSIKNNQDHRQFNISAFEIAQKIFHFIEA